MSGKISSRKFAAFSWLLILVLSVVLALRQGLSYDSSILTLLPESDQQPVVQQAVDQMNRGFSQRLLLLWSGEDEQILRRSIPTIADNLLQLEEVSDVFWRLEPRELKQQSDELYPYRFHLLENGIRQLLLAGEYQSVRDGALLDLYSPVGGSAGPFNEDPFGLYSAVKMNPGSSLNIEISDSLLKIANTDKPSYLMILSLEGEVFSPELQDRVLGVIDAQYNQYSASLDKPRLSGMLVHAAAGARQAKAEISTIGFGSLLGIVIAILVVFRRTRSLLYLLVPVAIGCTFATSMVLLAFGKVHLVTFAFGAGLVGVSIDYALHYLCERRVSPAFQALEKILPGLVFGLFSSVMAYGALLLTPFPGLRQMALFSVAGLLASWLTVVLWLPSITAKDSQQTYGFARQLTNLIASLPKFESKPGLAMLLLVPVVLAAGLVWNASSQDDVRLLQTSPASLVSEEQKLQKLLGTSSSSRFFLVSGDTLEETIQKQEQLVAELDALHLNGQITGFQALSSSLPSIKRQTENYDLVRRLYASQLLDYYQFIGLPESGELLALNALEQAQGHYLTPDKWQQLALSREAQGLVIESSKPGVTAVVRINGNLDESALEHLNTIAAATESILFVDSLQDISSLLERYRLQIINWILLAYLLVFIVLLVRYKAAVIRVVLPPVIASIFTLAILAQVEGGINLFHLMALILVLGIGLDMGIFLSETSEAPQTWLAVSLSGFTSLMAFGLLALSATPVLHHFGITVAIGLTLVWVLVVIMRKH